MPQPVLRPSGPQSDTAACGPHPGGLTSEGAIGWSPYPAGAPVLAVAVGRALVRPFQMKTTHLPRAVRGRCRLPKGWRPF